MPSQLDYERFGLSRQRFDQQSENFDSMMDFRQQQADRTFGYREQHDDEMMAHRMRQAEAARQMAMMRMLPRGQRAQMAQQYFTEQPQPDPQTEWNAYAADFNAAKRERDALDSSQMSQMAARQRMPGGPTFSQFGDEFFLNGQPYQPDLLEGGRTNPAIIGDMARNEFAEQRHNWMQGQIGGEAVRGNALADIRQQDIAAQQQAARFKAARDRIAAQQSFWGFNPGEATYDQKTGMAKLPDRMTASGDTIPGRSIAVPPNVAQLWQDDLGAISGMDGSPDMMIRQQIQQKAQREQTFLQKLGVPSNLFEEVQRAATEMSGGNDPDDAALERAALAVRAARAPAGMMSNALEAGERDRQALVARQRQEWQGRLFDGTQKAFQGLPMLPRLGY